MKPLEETKYQKVRFKYLFHEPSHNLSYISWYKYIYMVYYIIVSIKMYAEVITQCKRVHIIIAQFAIFRVFQEVNGS